MELYQVLHIQIGQMLIYTAGRKGKCYQIMVKIRYLMKRIFGQDIILVYQDGLK